MRSCGGPVTNQQLIEWVEWALQQRPSKTDRARGRDALGEPPRLATGSGVDLATELEGFPEPSSEPHESSIGTEAPTRSIVKAASRPSAHGTRRAWLLLLLLLALAVAARAQLVDTGRQLHAWYAG
jgi:hypothetical protein